MILALMVTVPEYTFGSDFRLSALCLYLKTLREFQFKSPSTRP